MRKQQYEIIPILIENAIQELVSIWIGKILMTNEISALVYEHFVKLEKEIISCTLIPTMLHFLLHVCIIALRYFAISIILLSYT